MSAEMTFREASRIARLGHPDNWHVSRPADEAKYKLACAILDAAVEAHEALAMWDAHASEENRAKYKDAKRKLRRLERGEQGEVK